jgi:hypothetical protein
LARYCKVACVSRFSMTAIIDLGVDIEKSRLTARNIRRVASASLYH